MRLVIRFAVALLVVALWSATALAQAENPPAKTKEAGQTSGHGMTPLEQLGQSGSAENQIRALDEQDRQAALKGDANFLEQYLAPNYIAIRGDGSEMNRDQEIQMRKSGAWKLDAIDVRDTKIRFFGNNVAIVSHDAFVRGTGN